MKNDNDLILERLRGIHMQKGTWRDKFDPQNPNVPQANDNVKPPTNDTPLGG
jgi:hypothetical protein